jgi:acetyltransferase
MMERTRIFHALQGVRGKPPVDLAALEQVLVRFSQLVVEQPWIREIDINPLLASLEQIVALDARILLHDPESDPDTFPRLAVRSYPSQYAKPYKMTDGTQVNIRPIRPEDEPMIAEFHQGLSAQSVFMRYFHSIELSQRVAHDRLTRICFIDYDREMALVVIQRNPDNDVREILAVGRLSKLQGTEEAEFALIIQDEYQRQGLGTELLSRLMKWGKNEGVRLVSAYMLPENSGMKRICQKLGFSLSFEDNLVKAEKILGSTE